VRLLAAAFMARSLLRVKGPLQRAAGSEFDSNPFHLETFAFAAQA
jgi:hypothetical protein